MERIIVYIREDSKTPSTYMSRHMVAGFFVFKNDDLILRTSDVRIFPNFYVGTCLCIKYILEKDNMIGECRIIKVIPAS